MAETNMQFALLPAGSETTASTRIRVYTFARELAKRGIPATIGFSLRANVFFVQKRVSSRTLKWFRFVKLRNNIILYDIDDLGDALWCWVSPKVFRKMICLVDVITTASAAQAEQLNSMYGITWPKIVLPAIDYYPTGPVRPQLLSSKPLRVLWFGHSANFELIGKYLDTLSSIPGTEVIIVTLSSIIEANAARYSRVQFIPWSLSTFITVLQSCHLTCLTHDGSAEDRAKGNNKMITSITWGVPAVVSRTPEYERTAREAGVGHAVFGDEKELRTVIGRLRSPEARSQYLDTAQPIIWKHYSPDVIAQNYIELVTQTRKHNSIVKNIFKVLNSYLPHYLNFGLKGISKNTL